MADVNRGNRPLSPHLQVYHLPLAAVTSIVNRAAGQAMVAGLLLRGAAQLHPLRAVLSGIAGEAVMVGGYYVFEAVFITNSWVGALVEIPGNLVQAAFGVAAGTALLFALRDTPLLRAHAAR